MLAAAEDVGIAQSAQKFARVDDRPASDRPKPRANSSPDREASKAKIEDGSEVDVEAKSAAVFADDAAVLAKELAIAGGEDIGGERRGTDHVAEAVHLAAFEIHAGEKRRGHMLLAIAQQACVCSAPVMLRAKRITPAGWIVVSREARRGDISVPSKPMMRSWPMSARN